MYPEFLKRNVSLAAISTDDTADALKMAELTGAEFAILSDEDAAVAKDYGVYNLLHDGLATPSAVIVSSRGDIEWQYVGKSISDRPTPDEILAQVDRLIQ